jgi:hypothetical protein
VPDEFKDETIEKSEELDTPPTDSDVYFGNDDHPGTKDLRQVVQKSLESFADEEYSAAVYKAIRKQLTGKRFFKADGREASKFEIRTEVGRTFDEEKERLQKE